MNQNRVVIIGGTSGFGKWLALYIKNHFSEVDIVITGSNSEKGQKSSKELGVHYEEDNITAIKKSNIIIYSVPISKTKEVIENTLEYIKSGSIVLDVTSIKKIPSEAMNKRNDIIVIPTHPMFGPYISTLAGQVVVLTSDEKTKKQKEYQALKNFLQEKKVKVIEKSPEYHDKMMAVVQGLTHHSMFVIGETIKRLDFDIKDSLNFVSPIYKLMISSVGRYLSQDPRLYADIQMHNECIEDVHKAFLETSRDFMKSVQRSDTGKFCSDIIEAREYIGEDICDEGQFYTDKIIAFLGKQTKFIRENLGNIIKIENIYTGERVSGKLIDFKENTLLLGDKKYSLNKWEILYT